MGIYKMKHKQVYKTYNQITKEFDVLINKYNNKYCIELVKKKMTSCVKHKNTKNKKSKMTLDKLATIVLQLQRDLKRIVKVNNLKY